MTETEQTNEFWMDRMWEKYKDGYEKLLVEVEEQIKNNIEECIKKQKHVVNIKNVPTRHSYIYRRVIDSITDYYKEFGICYYCSKCKEEASDKEDAKNCCGEGYESYKSFFVYSEPKHESFECYICKNSISRYRKKVTHTCNSNESMCFECYQKLNNTTCPLCRGDLSYRNII